MLGISRDLFKQPVNSKPLLIKPGGLCQSFALVAGDHKSPFHRGLYLPPLFLSSLPPQAGKGCGVVWWRAMEQAPSPAPPELSRTRSRTGWAFSKVPFSGQTLQPASPRAHCSGEHIRAHPSMAFQTGFPGGHGFGGASRQQIQP